MSYLLSQIFLYMAATFLLGLALGWLVWRSGAPDLSKGQSAEHDKLKAELAKELKTSAELRGENAGLKSKLGASKPKSA